MFCKVRLMLSYGQYIFMKMRSLFTQFLNHNDYFYSCNDGYDGFDTQKAFDSVPHNVTLNNFTAFGFDDAFIHLISSCLSHDVQRARVDNSLSFEGRVSSILGSLQFQIYVNDPLDGENHSNPYSFGDDLKLLSSGSWLNGVSAW